MFHRGERTTDGIGALEHIIRVGGMFVIPADRFDTSTYSKIGDAPTTYYYENYAGGIGVAKKLFSVWHDVLKKGIEIAESCACRSGCQNCIEPAKNYNTSNAEDKIDKRGGIALATHILEEAKRGPDGKIPRRDDGSGITFLLWATLMEVFMEFIEKLKYSI